MNWSFPRLGLFTALACAAAAQSASATPIIFDDFNTGEGHFASAPNASGQNTGLLNTSTADRVTTNGPLEGAGHEKLVLVHDGTANLRVRFLSGGGTVASNTAFTTGPGEDGFIGFYLKTTAQSFTIGLNLDGSDGAAASMDMGVVRTVNGDGQWHLYEWNLDDVDASWSPVTSIGGDGVLQDGSHTIDSIYIFSNQTGTAGQAQPDIYIDFVAKSDSGSIAALIPEPSSVGMLALGMIGMLGSRRGKRS